MSCYPKPFATPNGIPKEQSKLKFEKLCNNDHEKAKEFLQKKYFKMEALDRNKAIFSFVGRITKQKGVHLIL
jgi:glycogen synthase